MIQRVGCGLLLVLCALEATAYPVEAPQDAALFGRTRRVGSVYLLEILDQPQREEGDNEFDNYIPSGDYSRRVPVNFLILPQAVAPQKKFHNEQQDVDEVSVPTAFVTKNFITTISLLLSR